MDDKNIIELLWHRLEQGLTELHLKYGNFLYSLAYRLLCNREDSEECVNDSYLKTWNSIPPTRPHNLKYFVGRIVRNSAIDRIKHDQAEKRGKNTTLLLSELEECIPSDEDPASHYLKDELLHQISEYLKTLNAPDRELFLRRYWLGQSLSELSQMTGKSESYLAGRLFKLRRRLKNKFTSEEV